MNSMSVVAQMESVLADIVWRPGTGARWIWWISAAHLVASCLCFLAGRSQRTASDETGTRPTTKFWFALSGFMIVLCLNKILDLQSLVTIFLRQMAQSEGWFENRRSFQAAFVIVAAVMGVMLLFVSVSVFRGRWRQCGLAYLAAVFLLTLVVIRTASYHPVDRFLYGLSGVGNRMNAGLELGGAILVGLGALFALPRSTHSSSPL